jgi:hypothetical protein
MRRVEVLIGNGLEVACRQTRYLEWIPGWNRVYHCKLANWSSQLDQRWATSRWPIHPARGVEGWDEWEQWYESLSDEERQRGDFDGFD